MPVSSFFLRAGALSLSVVSALPGWAQQPAGAGQGPAARPPYDILREQENYGFLSPDSLRTRPVPPDVFDPLKYAPLGRRPGSFLTLGLDIRYQYEISKNDNWGAGAPADAPPTNAYLLQRHVAHADWRLGPHLRVFGQVLSDNVAGRRGGPRPQIDRDPLDLYQGFVEWTQPLGPRGRAELRVGRQEFLYGSERLLSMREGPNVRQSFDAARLALHYATWRLDVLVGRPLLTNWGVFDDKGDPQQVLWGAYAVHTLARWDGGVDLYYFGLNKHDAVYLQGIGHEQRQTAGVRLWRRETPARPFGYNVELIGQAGRFGAGQIRAYYASGIGYYQRARWPSAPTFRVQADAISGDQDRGQPNLQAFNALFPRPFFGNALTPIGPGNLLDLHPGVELHLQARMTLSVDVAWLWRASPQDVAYSPSVSPILPADAAPGPAGSPLSTRRYIGRQLTADWSWRASQHFSFGFTYAWIPAGDYLRDTTPGRTLSYYKPTVLFQF